MKNTCTKIVVVLLVLCFAFELKAQNTTPVEAYGQLRVSGKNMVDKNGNIVQLQGMSLFWSQWEGEFYTQGAVQQLKNDWCTNIVRAAMAVEELGYLTNPTTEKNKVKTVVDAAIAEGMYVIIDWHDHNAHNHTAQAVEFFTEMAQTYGSYPNVIYEVFNEPLNHSWANQIKPYCETVINAIRKYDPDNIIVCGTRSWSQRVDEVVGNRINDDNVMYTLHFYAGSHGAELRGYAETAMNAGIPLFVTEFGTVNANGGGGVNQNSSNTWFSWMDQHNLTHCNWSLCDKDEGSAALTPGTNASATYKNNLTTAGQFIYNQYTNNCPVYEVQDPIDCNGVTNGTAALDNCGVCAGGNTGKIPNENCEQDCNGDWGGTAFVDDCDRCVGGNTGNISCNQDPYGGTPHPIPGRIESEEYDEGGQDVAFNDTDNNNEGNSSLRNDGVDLETTGDSEGNVNIGWLAAGAWCESTLDVEATGTYTFEIRLATIQNNKTLKVTLDGNNVSFNVSVPNTGDYQVYQTVTIENVELVAGEQIMRVDAITDGFNVNYIEAVQVQQVTLDCNEDPNGTATIDACGICSGGNTGLEPKNPIIWYQDIDGDGVGDASNTLEDCNQPDGYVAESGDQCPQDINKTEPGNCGCGNSEQSCLDCNNTPNGMATIDICGVCVGGTTGTTSKDDDNDGVLNCEDECPNTPSNESSNIVGCSYEQLDDDNDGTLNGADECPNDENKIVAGDCGCGKEEGTCKDCNNVINGTAEIDNCGVCSGGNTGKTPNITCQTDCNGVDGGSAYLDNCGTCVGGNTLETPCEGILQGENYCVIDGQTSSINGGFTGSGYANFDNEIGMSATWVLNAIGNQTVDFTFRHAYGGTANRNCEVFVNGQSQGIIAFTSTGSYSTWANVTKSLTLLSGTNNITLVSVSTDGGSNIDRITWGTSPIVVGSCEEDCDGMIGGRAHYDKCEKCIGGNTGEVSDDFDQDGVIDCEDECLNTPSGSSVDSTGCLVTGVSSADIKASLFVYPIPAEDYLIVQQKFNEYTHIKVKTLTGTTILEESLISNHHKLHLEGLNQGVYIIQLFGDNKSEQIKVIKN